MLRATGQASRQLSAQFVRPRQESLAVLAEHASSQPQSVRWAVYLALAAFGVALVNTYRLGPQASSLMNPAFPWAYTVITSILWLLLIFLFFRGRNWARLAFCVLALLSIPGTVLANVFQVADPTSRLVSGSQAVLNVSAAVFLLIPASGQWYREGKGARGRGAA